MTERVAVVAVHGVADQKLGDTAQAVAELLIAQAPNGSSYAPGIRSDLVLQVPPIEPIRPIAKTEATLGKHLLQSAGSDFLKEGWSAKGRQRAIDGGETPLSRGAEFTEYLLMKSRQNGMPTDTCVAPRISLSRNKGSHVCDVDIYEMHWADLSRLSGSVPRILTELFTLFFRLSSLGRDTVQIAASNFAGSRRWRVLRWLQMALDWLYSRVLALLFLQLVMAALILVPLALASTHVTVVHGIASVVAGSVLFLWLAYRYRYFFAAAAAGLASGVGLYYLHPAPAVGLLWLAILSVAYDWWMRVCDERFKMVRVVGWVLWAITLFVVVIFAAGHETRDLGMWVQAALRAMEATLFLIVAWWVTGGVLLLAWFGAGSVAARMGREVNQENSIEQNFQARASVATGRLGLVISLGFFLVSTMSGWALVDMGVKAAVDGFDYTPVIFDKTISTCAAGKCAAGFLEDRFVNSTEMFSAVSVLLLLLVAYMLVVFTPSVLSELKLSGEQSGRLGKWLTGGFRHLDPLVGVIAAAGVLLAFVVGLVLLWLQTTAGPGASELLDTLVKSVSDGSRQFLTPLVYAAGAGIAALSAAGGMLSRYVPWLRVPLDAGIDVDNHLREFPRKAIPRARIFARYVAVLEHLAREEKPYDRIVVVSHSQGTVISAELFRYMKERAGARGGADQIQTLWSKLDRKIRLLTAGCPLRQLYAARFPVMYDWVLGTGHPQMGPVAGDVGVTEWLNVYTTGDYVGRWLWSRHSTADDLSAPLIDAHDVATGNDAYVPNGIRTDKLETLMNGQTEKDICLGAGAHTHYFDKDQEIVASTIDAMIVSR